MTTQNYSLRIAIITMMCGLFLTGCGGGGGGDGGNTTTTSRTLPPDPGSAANSTLRGIDVNNNGVRDEVERDISSKTPIDADFNKTMAVAKIYQNMITDETPKSRSDALNLYSQIICLSTKGVGKVYSEIDGQDWVVSQTFNTKERQNKYQLLGDALNGGFDAEELLSCE
jgi:hypothetical protein